MFLNCQDLQKAFEAIERWDVFDDTETFFEKDVQVYIENLKRSLKKAEDVVANTDLDILTIETVGAATDHMRHRDVDGKPQQRRHYSLNYYENLYF
ncbi:uncharacterized protein LOC122509885 isoform X2 [Leptopilina heterotoma]|uniref:uncharacterized protein LOC122509885 isoform X2 n=1 Tax=Leptopilina heterotoma TaxID=63436 RepID=UPI001CA898E5|nr:uncharacterized protein LOC122509885 isoform X2 [Leptopilina heterotoma]